MKYIFLSILAILIVASIAISWTNRKAPSGKPVIYWVTDNNPARALQIKNFESWMKKNGYPDVELRVDTANGDLSKKIIQSVSGVGGDVMDTYPGYGDLIYFNEIGLVEDVTDATEIDGASKWRLYWDIILPLLARPGLITLTIFTFMGNYQSFFWPLVMLKSVDKYTLPIGLLFFDSTRGQTTHLMMAGVTMSVLPMVVLFVILQKYMVKGIQLGGVKG